MRRRIHAYDIRRRIHACVLATASYYTILLLVWIPPRIHTRRRIHACNMRRIHVCVLATASYLSYEEEDTCM
jgi:hypothetical protein